MRKIAHVIDSINGWIGAAVKYLIFLVVGVAAYNAVARYLSKSFDVNLSSNALIEAQWYLFSIVFLFGAANALRTQAHVRVDVLYNRLGERGKAWVNLLGACFFLIPFCFITIGMCFDWVYNSWVVWEVSPDPGGLPRYPIKTLVPIAFSLLALQGFSEGIKAVDYLKKDKGSEV